MSIAKRRIEEALAAASEEDSLDQAIEDLKVAHAEVNRCSERVRKLIAETEPEARQYWYRFFLERMNEKRP